MSKKFVSFLMVSVLAIFSACGEKEQEITVQSIALSQPSAELIIGETLNLKATVSPSNATYDGITWTSTKTSVATVSSSGQVSALAEGNTTITAMAGGKTASCSVTVVKGYVAVSSISLNKDSIELVEGDSETLSATVSPNDATDKTVSWSSSNDAVATVKDGTITAIKEGEATITAKAGEKTASCKVVVAKKVIPVESIGLNKTELALVEGDTETLTATISPEDATDKTISWTSSRESIATVKDGIVTAISEGEATITAKAGEKTASCKVVVAKKVIPVETVSLDKEVLELLIGESATLIATVKPDAATDKSVLWSSSNEAIASVDNTGVVVGKAEGNAIITAMSGDKTATCSILVSKDPKEEAIVFADTNLKSVLVSAFDTNGDGELSFKEAASVHSLDGVFDKFKACTTFDEFQYFTSVNAIPKKCFARMPLLSSIKLPDSITIIDDYAFTECSKLQSIFIPANVMKIGYRVFEKCYSLSSVVFADDTILSTLDGYSIYDIDGYRNEEGGLFAYCNSLISFVIPASISKLGTRLFYQCSSLKSVSFEEGSTITEIPGDSWNAVGGPFNFCPALETVSLPQTITSIGWAAFAGCESLRTINLPKGIKRIDSEAFIGCSQLEGDISLPECIVIGNYAFDDCKHLHSIVLGEDCITVGAGAFNGCTGLVKVILSSIQTRIEEKTFNGCSSLKTIELPSHLLSISNNAFKNCIRLNAIIIPSGVSFIGDCAFGGCKNILSITVIPETPPIGEPGMFTDTNDAPIYVPSESVDAYKSAQYWSDYADRIQAIQE